MEEIEETLKTSCINSDPLSHPQSPFPSTSSPLEERVSTLEKSLQCRCDGFSQELKLIWAELNIITEWISNRFGVGLVDKSSILFKSIQELDQIEELSKVLSLLSKVPIQDKCQSATASSSCVIGTGTEGVPRRRRGRPPGSGKKNSPSTSSSSRSSLNKSALKSLKREITNDDHCNNPHTPSPGFVHVKEEQEDFNDPFEDGYIPPGLDDDHLPQDNDDEIEGSRPRRSTTRNISYDGFMESDEDEVKLPVKRSQRGRPRKADKVVDPDAEIVLDPSIENKQEPKPKNQRKKYKPSDASTLRAKVLANTPMMCDICGRVVKGPWTLKAHTEMHANIRRYTCHICGFAFRRRPHLNAHLLLHEGVKSLKCQFCEKGFYLRRDLDRHTRTHTGERPYSCTFPNCNKSFSVSQHRTMHYRTHTGERPYKCDICDKTFSQANTLRLHKKGIHGGTKGGTNIPRKRPRQQKQLGTQSSSGPPDQTEASTFTPTATSKNATISPTGHSSSPHPLQPEGRLSTPAPRSTTSQQEYRSPIDTQSLHSPSPYPESRPISNINPPNSSHPFDMLNHSWRQGLSQQSVSGIGNTAGLFLPQMYEPLNMHYGSYPPSNS